MKKGAPAAHPVRVISPFPITVSAQAERILRKCPGAAQALLLLGVVVLAFDGHVAVDPIYGLGYALPLFHGAVEYHHSE